MHSARALCSIAHALHAVVHTATRAAALLREHERIKHACPIATRTTRLASRDTKGRVVTRKEPSLSKLGRDTNFRPRHQFQVAAPRTPDHVSTLKPCRDTNFAKPCWDIKNCAATLLQLILPLPCRDTIKASPCHDINNCVTTPNA